MRFRAPGDRDMILCEKITNSVSPGMCTESTPEAKILSIPVPPTLEAFMREGMKGG